MRAGSCVVKIIVMILVIAGAGAAAWFFGRQQVGEYAQGRIVSEIEKRLPAGSKIGSMEYKAPFSVVMNGVSMDGGKAAGGEIFKADAMVVSVSLRALLRGKIEISSVVCRNPVLRVVRFRSGKTNLEEIFRDGERKEGALNLVLVKPELIFLDQYASERAYRFTAEKAALRLRGCDPMKVNITGGGYGRSRFDMRGTAGTEAGAPVRLKVESGEFYVGDIAVLAGLAGPGAPVIENFEAPLSFRADITGTRGGEVVSAAVSAPGGELGGAKIESIRVNGTWSGDKIDLKNVFVRLKSGGEASGRLSYFTGAGESMLDLDLKSGNFPLEAISGVVNGWSPGITGQVTGNARIKGDPGKKETLRGRITARAGGGMVEKMIGDDPLPYDVIDFNSDIAGGVVRVKGFVIQGPDMDMSLDGTVGMDGALNLHGRAEICKEKAKSQGVKKLVGAMLPDGTKGYVLRVKIVGRVGEPKVEYSVAKTVYRGVEDHVRDAGNKVEKIFKKVF